MCHIVESVVICRALLKVQQGEKQQQSDPDRLISGVTQAAAKYLERRVARSLLTGTAHGVEVLCALTQTKAAPETGVSFAEAWKMARPHV